MLSVKVRRVLLARHRIDFRRRFDGLLAESFALGADPYDGDCVVFIKKDHTQLRAIVGDGVGLYLVCRRFEGGGLRKLAAFAEEPFSRCASWDAPQVVAAGRSRSFGAPAAHEVRGRSPNVSLAATR